MLAERAQAAASADEWKRAAREEQERAVAAASAEAAAESWRKARAETDAEMVKLRRAVDTTSLWYEDLLDTARAERDRCSGELSYTHAITVCTIQWTSFNFAQIIFPLKLFSVKRKLCVNNLTVNF